MNFETDSQNAPMFQPDRVTPNKFTGGVKPCGVPVPIAAEPGIKSAL